MTAPSATPMDNNERTIDGVQEEQHPLKGGTLPAVRSKEAQLELKEKVSLIARVFSKTHDIDVVPSPMGGWAVSVPPKTVEAVMDYLHGKRATLDDLPPEFFKPRTLLYNPADIEKMPMKQVLGVTRHEVAHVLHTDMKLGFDGQKLAQSQGYLPTTFHTLWNFVEDIWINNKECADSDVVKEQMDALYDETKDQWMGNLSAQPLIRQLGLQATHYWRTGEGIPHLRDLRVHKVFEQVRPYLDQYFWGENSQKNFETLRDHIWPICRVLEEQGVEDQMLKELMERMMGGDGGPGKQGGQGQGGKMSKLKEALNKLRGKGSGGKNEKDELSKEIDERASGDLKEQLKKELKGQKDQGGGGSSSGGNSARKQKKRPAQELSPSELSPETRKKLEELMKSLPPDKQSEMQKRAREKLDDKQADEIRKNGPRYLEVERDQKTGENVINFRRPPSEKKIKKAKQKAESAQRQEQKDKDTPAPDDKEQKDKLSKQAAELKDMQDSGFTPDERQLYREYKKLEREVRPIAETMIRRIENELPRELHFIHTGAHESGRKINTKVLGRRIPLKDPRINLKRETVVGEETKLQVIMLIDNTASMLTGDKWH